MLPTGLDVLISFGLSLLYEIMRHWFVYILMLLASNVLIARIFGRLKSIKDIAIFWVCMFLLLSSAVVLLGQRPATPNFNSGINNVRAGSFNNGKDTVVIIEMSAINVGNTQSILTNWTVTYNINGTQYKAVMMDMPPVFTFNLPDAAPDSPTSLVYKREDQLVVKSQTAVQPGGLVAGIILAIFEGIKVESFLPGTEIKVSFNDAFGNPYAAVATVSAQRIAQRTTTLPGLHTEMICHAPPGLLKQLQQQPSAPQTPIPPSSPRG